MVDTPRKTFPELQALSAPVVDTDVLAVYRTPGPAKRTTASVLGSYVNTVIGTAFTRTLLATASNSAFLTALGQIASSFVDFIQSGTGAVTRTAQAKLRDVVSVKDFGATGDGSTNDSSAINLALATGKAVYFPEGTYKAANLTSSASDQVLFTDGNVTIQKNANGDLLTLSGNNVTLRGLKFAGDASSPTFTGSGVVASGDNFSAIDCASYWMSGRALKATGGHTQIIGTKAGAVYQTTDATASGYDIELGVSGTATLYHQLIGVYTSQSTGGILMTDTGSHAIVGGQFGKLAILAGTSPAGVNGGTTTGARIIGNVTCNLSNATFTGNAFSAITFTIGVGTSGITLDGSNIFSSGATVTNNGNGSNLIQLDGAVGGQVAIKYGGTTSLAVVGYDPATGDQYITNGYTRYANNRGVIFNSNANITMSGSNLGIVNNSGANQYGSVSQHQFIVSGTVYGTINTTGFLLPSGTALYNNSIKVVGAQGAAVADATGGVVIDAEARTALNALLARLRTHGLIAT